MIVAFWWLVKWEVWGGNVSLSPRDHITHNVSWHDADREAGRSRVEQCHVTLSRDQHLSGKRRLDIIADCPTAADKARAYRSALLLAICVCVNPKRGSILAQNSRDLAAVVETSWNKTMEQSGLASLKNE